LFAALSLSRQAIFIAVRFCCQGSFVSCWQTKRVLLFHINYLANKIKGLILSLLKTDQFANFFFSPTLQPNLQFSIEKQPSTYTRKKTTTQKRKTSFHRTNFTVLQKSTEKQKKQTS